jgi:branched-chain amino acid transport system permease protein
LRKKGRAKSDLAREMALVSGGQQWTAWGIFFALLIVLPVALVESRNLNWLSFINFTFITIIAVLGLNVITGMSGQVNLGHSAFTMVGGYTLAVLTVRLSWPFWAALVLGIIVTALVGIIIAVPAMRLKGFYVAVVTLAFFFIAQYIIRNLSIAGGFNGFIGVPSPSIGGLKFDSDFKWYYLLLALTALSIVGSANLRRSRFGRAFLAIRDNDVTASSLGINVPMTKIRAFFIGALFAGLAGGLWTSYVSVIRLDQFNIWDSIWYVGMVIIGGAGSTAGTVMGVIFLRLISQVLHVISVSGVIPLSSNTSAAVSYAIFGVAIILFMSFQPYGLIALWRKFKTNYRRWPFGV